MQTAADMSSDGEIVEAVLNGERERFSLLVGRYQRALLRLAESRLGRLDWAEDVVQESFLCALKSLHTYNSQYSFRTWLWTIALNQCRRHYGRRARRPQVAAWSETAQSGDATADSAIESGEAAPEQQLLEKERAEQVAGLLAELPEAQADALRLRFFGGLKFHEIAEVMGCSLSSAKNRVRWGLEKMSQRIESASPAGDPLLGEPL